MRSQFWDFGVGENLFGTFNCFAKKKKKDAEDESNLLGFFFSPQNLNLTSLVRQDGRKLRIIGIKKKDVAQSSAGTSVLVAVQR